MSGNPLLLGGMAEDLLVAHRASQEFTRSAAFALEAPDQRQRMLVLAKELREALNKLLTD